MSAWWIWVGCQSDPDWIIVGEDPSDLPLDGLPQEEIDRFDQGDVLFETRLRETQGLGPVYIRTACGSCHADDARGPGIVRKMALQDDSGSWVSDEEGLPYGGTERPYVAGGATTPILPPDLPNLVVTTRSPPAVFGRGWLEAIEEDEILAVEAAQAAGGRVSGRVNRVCWEFDGEPADSLHDFAPGDCDLVGRFGAKARIPTVEGFTADAYQGDMAITSPLRSSELPNPDLLIDDALAGTDIDAETIDLVSAYVRMLRIPNRLQEDAEGRTLFEEVGCAECHVPSMRTRSDHPLEPLRSQDAAVYTDLLLHDLGPDHADGRSEGTAGPSEWRTAPLIGLRFLVNYLHDGRAQTIEDAIVLHGSEGSEAAPSVETFQALSADERDALLRFVEAL
jgi:CxxC motif-containing protein (DUF1111 family)